MDLADFGPFPDHREGFSGAKEVVKKTLTTKIMPDLKYLYICIKPR
jgi:hypothetical protein